MERERQARAAAQAKAASSSAAKRLETMTLRLHQVEAVVGSTAPAPMFQVELHKTSTGIITSGFGGRGGVIPLWC